MPLVPPPPPEPQPGAMPAAISLILAATGFLLLMVSQLLLVREIGLLPTVVVSEMLLLAPAVLGLRLLGVPARPGLGLYPLDRRTTFVAFAAGGSLWAVGLGLLEIQFVVWHPAPEYFETFRRLHELLRPTGIGSALASLTVIALAPAVCEETLMRGIVLPSLLRSFGRRPAVLVSALMFAAIHWDLYRFLFTFAVGMGLAELRLRTGSLISSMLAPATLNPLTLVCAQIWSDSAREETGNPWLGMLFLVAGTAVTYGLSRLLRRGSFDGSEKGV